MGFYIRKSLSVGPFRFNLSKSGVGLSVGVRGFRIGASPRGNYVHVGRHGIYYRATLPKSRPKADPGRTPGYSEHDAPPLLEGTHEPLQDIESSAASQIVDSTSQELLKEIREKRAKLRLAPSAYWITLGLLGAGVLNRWPTWSLAAIALAGGALALIARRRDALAKTVILFYELDPEMEREFEAFHRSATDLAACQGKWHIGASGRVHDRKYHAGATSLVRRRTTSITRSSPPFLASNVDIIAIDVGSQMIYFLPDKLLVYDSTGVGAVAYRHLEVSALPTKFVEEDIPARDAHVVEHTWRFVNKNGTPDRRFKNNTQIPVCLYGEIHFSSQTGLNEVIQVSKAKAATDFAKAIESLARRLPSTPTSD